MKNIDVRVFSDKFDPLITNFRRDVYVELGGDPLFLTEECSAKDFKSRNPGENCEDLYRFSAKKWNETNFTNIFAAIDDGKIIGFSGTKLYGKYLRVSIYLYVLRKYRGKFINLKYRPGGFFENQMSMAKSLSCEAIFFSIYPHNKKTRSLLRNHSGRSISTDLTGIIENKNKLKLIEEAIIFNGVQQYIVYCCLKKSHVFELDMIKDK